MLHEETFWEVAREEIPLHCSRLSQKMEGRRESRVLETRPEKKTISFLGRKPKKEKKVWHRQQVRRCGMRRAEEE